MNRKTKNKQKQPPWRTQAELSMVSLWCATVFSLSALFACRDETGGEIPPTPSAAQEMKEVAQEPSAGADSISVSSAATGPVPFLIENGKYFLGETSVPQVRHSNFESFLASQEGLAMLQDAGVEVHVAEDLIEVQTSNDLVLAFEEFGTTKPLRFKTNGRNLALIADKLVNTEVVTQAPGAPAGNLKLVVRSKLSGKFDLSGAVGENGADGVCPQSHPSCLTEPRPQFAAEALRSEILWRDEVEERRYSNPSAGLDIFPRFNFLPFTLPRLNDPEVLASCSLTRTRVTRLVPGVEGLVKVYRRIPEVRWLGERSGRDGYLSQGLPGKSGQAGGNLHLVKLNAAVADYQVYNEGGNSGSSGKDAVVLPAPAPMAAPATAIETTRFSAAELRAVYEYAAVVHYGRMRSNCTRGGCPSSCETAMTGYSGKLSQQAQTPEFDENQVRTFDPPETFAGKLPMREPEVVALAGAAGTKEVIEVDDFISVDFQAEFGFVVPLPQALRAK